MKTIRCEDLIVQLIVREYDDLNRPVREQISQPIKVFRNAQTRDFWGEVDKAVEAMRKPAAAPKVPAGSAQGERKKKR